MGLGLLGLPSPFSFGEEGLLSRSSSSSLLLSSSLPPGSFDDGKDEGKVGDEGEGLFPDGLVGDDGGLGRDGDGCEGGLDPPDGLVGTLGLGVPLGQSKFTL